MAKARAITKRRRAVRNIRKITQTMQLIATARFQKCMQRALSSQPYTARIREMIQTLAAAGAAEHRLLRPQEGVAPSILLTITSSRGLCGAYNMSVLRTALEHRQKLIDQGLAPELEMVGKKGVNYFRFLDYDLAATITDVEDRIAFSRVAEMAERYIRLYEQGAVARVDVAYTRFHSVGLQRSTIMQLLPIEPPAQPASETPTVPVQFEFSPAPAGLLARLIPEAVKVQLFQCFNDSIVSEQVSRMVAMKAATDAAGDMIKYLTRQYNRARQTQITLELADIVGGANAVG
ncbi:MAG: ATP synthase F1 subunit gamma [Phycisphaerae bacterium]|jgi:F-type H+-transporting ATPase subunit gamma